MRDPQARLPELHPRRLYTARDIADLFGIHVSTLFIWRRDNAFPPPRRIGPRTVRWTGQQIIDHLNGNGPQSAANAEP